MTQLFLYIQTGVQLNTQTRFYKVAIGQSEKQLNVRAWLESYAIEHGHFFALWNANAVAFLDKCLDSVNRSPLDVQHIVGTALVRSLKSGTEDPETYEANRNRHNLMKQIDPNYYAYYQMSKIR